MFLSAYVCVPRHVNSEGPYFGNLTLPYKIYWCIRVGPPKKHIQMSRTVVLCSF